MAEALRVLAGYAGDICAIGGCMALLCRPVRERLLGLGQVQEGVKCLLRAEIVRIYYHNLKDRALQEYEYRNLMQCYTAYKALHGNSFVSKLVGEMQNWEIIP